ncbi:ABC transporter substrate-binding protein [Oceanobacillus iheyensis]|uniref:Branched-chain amino acid ABC transporter amino acid-binding protein n=1 Tax=Oceanobacillus iheyensis (strain DSM 14371 / CIP 107618 / JCM 11309 / KCTC 3954 / HTE831) TaxID=221109 RepID=Q8ESF2_OCEIH|nr:ABC transporter substrate-binding protein [Oceanobacillus iheyensis]BAC12643.1 branched-chain amino acid ABC transporter amino acid-binding protein [Oceanobacillus iheyensis HTE831]
MRKNKIFLSLISFLLIVILTGCIDGNTSNNNSSDSSTKAETEEKVVNIGYTGPLSGSAALYGENTLNGLEMAAEEINEEGFEVNGETYKLNIVSLDDKYLPNESASNAKRLVQENATPIIYTPHSGGIAALQVFNEQENFIIGAYSSEPAITEQGNELTVRIPPSYHGYVEPFTTYSMERFGNKLAVIPPVTQYGQDWAEELLPHWEEQGGEVVHKASVDFAKETDFYTLLTNALESDPDVIFLGGPSEPTANVVNQARQLGFEGGFIIMDQAKLDEMKRITETYDVLEGAIGTMPLVEADYPGVPAFVEKYTEEHGIEPGSEAGFHYVSLYIFVEAMKAAGNVEDATVIREHIQDGLDALPEDKQVYVIPSIDENGAFEIVTRVSAVEDGEIIGIPID